MKKHWAKLNNDIIAEINFIDANKINIKNRITLPPIPKGSVLKYLRWDGEKYIDLRKLDVIHVDEKGLLHCIPVEGSNPVKMGVADVKYLIRDNNRWRLQTKKEIRISKYRKRLKRIEAQRRTNYKIKMPIGDQLDAILKYLNTKDDLTPELKEVIKTWKETKKEFPKKGNN